VRTKGEGKGLDEGRNGGRRCWTQARNSGCARETWTLSRQSIHKYMMGAVEHLAQKWLKIHGRLSYWRLVIDPNTGTDRNSGTYPFQKRAATSVCRYVGTRRVDWMRPGSCVLCFRHAASAMRLSPRPTRTPRVQ